MGKSESCRGCPCLNINNDFLPCVSIVIPTFNNERTIKECLESVFMQNYPRDRFEVILVDGGSTDRTLRIVKNYPVRILHNRNRIEQGRNCGRDLGYRNARYELIAWLDADNIIVGDKWLRTMVAPFLNELDIFAVEPRPYARKDDIGIIRYLSYTTRGQDPFLCTYFYDLDSLPPIKKDGYTVYRLMPENSVGVGCCNGLIIKKAFIDKVGGFDYDIDVVYRIVSLGHAKIARADAYYIHKTVGSFYDFMKKRYRIIREYFFFKDQRTFPWNAVLKEPGFLRYVLSSLLLFGPTSLGAKKYRVYRDKAWFYHPFASFVTVMIYALYVLFNPNCWRAAFGVFS